MSDITTVMIAVLSALGGVITVLLLVGLFVLLRNSNTGKIFLSSNSPGSFDDDERFALLEANALDLMTGMERYEYFRAKSFQESQPPNSISTDISISQHLTIQEKGVSAWEFIPELEVVNCFVEARTEITFYDSECSVQSNLPIPKQSEVYYWEAKLYELSPNSLVSIGVSTKPYPLFRLPGYHKHSLAYFSDGTFRHNQPFDSSELGPRLLQGDVVGVGYKPRTGSIFITRNGKKVGEVAKGVKMNLFPTIGAQGSCVVHVNFGQMGFVYIEANVKKWGLAPQSGSLAPPPAYGAEQDSVLLQASTSKDSNEGQWIKGDDLCSDDLIRLNSLPNDSLSNVRRGGMIYDAAGSSNPPAYIDDANENFNEEGGGK